MTKPSYTDQAYIKLTGYDPGNQNITHPVYLLGNVVVGITKNTINPNSVGSAVYTNSGEFLVKETPEQVLNLINASIQ